MTHYFEPDTPPGPFVWLQGWYTAQCDGDWEHGEGVQISTLDNPGWTVRIGLAGTEAAEQVLDRVTVERDEHDWLQAWTEGGAFHAACGPLNLGEAVHLFRRWVLGLN